MSPGILAPDGHPCYPWLGCAYAFPHLYVAVLGGFQDCSGFTRNAYVDGYPEVRTERCHENNLPNLAGQYLNANVCRLAIT